jgi:diguanylate cyclase (GGDEF)-like protein
MPQGHGNLEPEIAVHMNLDVYTILVLLGTVCFLVGIGTLIAWSIERSGAGLLLWSISFFVRVPAFPLLILRGDIPDRLSIDLAGAFLFAGLGLSWIGARAFDRRQMRPFVAALPMLVWLAVCQVPEIYGDISARLFVHSSLMTLCTGAIAFEFWRGTRPVQRLRRSLALVFLVNSAVHLVRGGKSLYGGLSEDVLLGGNGLALSLFIPLVLVLLGMVVWLAVFWGEYVTRLKHDAEHDPLTNVLNRRTFTDRAEQQIGGRRAADTGLCLLLFDLDHFKAVNDTYGHQAGDDVLQQFCRLVEGELRWGDLLARLGGEEFAAVLPGAGPDEALGIAERVKARLGDAGFEVAGTHIEVTVSIGIAELSETTGSLADLMKQADAALYMAKRAGRNRAYQYQAGPQQLVVSGTSGAEAGELSGGLPRALPGTLPGVMTA